MFLPRVNDTTSKFHGCLASSDGKELKFDPNNEPTPPNGRGVQLCFKALPHYSSHTNGEKKNLPIPVNDEHELSRLYIQEFYNKEQDCSISKLDPGAIFKILKSASCFASGQGLIKATAGPLCEVRNKWAHAMIEQWDDNMFQGSFTKIEAMAKLLPNYTVILKKLNNDKQYPMTIQEFNDMKQDVHDTKKTILDIERNVQDTRKDVQYIRQGTQDIRQDVQQIRQDAHSTNQDVHNQGKVSGEEKEGRYIN